MTTIQHRTGTKQHRGAVRIAAIIPARMASSRFPGKSLLDVDGLPMVEHVRRRAARCRGFSNVVVATCDDEIQRAIESYGGRCVMTAPTHPMASDRVAEAMQQLDCTHVVNIQGDEILVLPSDLDRMVEAIRANPTVPAWNAVAKIEDATELSDRAIVKCVLSVSGRMMYCTRDCSRFAQLLAPSFEPLREVLGVLGFRREFLERFGRLARTPLELAESMDQSRIVEHDVEFRTVEFSRGYPGINEPKDVVLIRRYLEKDPAQRAMLAEILREPAPTPVAGRRAVTRVA